MSPSGGDVVVQFNTDRHGRPAGIEVYGRKLNYLCRLTDDGNHSGHFDLGFDAATRSRSVTASTTVPRWLPYPRRPFRDLGQPLGKRRA